MLQSRLFIHFLEGYVWREELRKISVFQMELDQEPIKWSLHLY